MKYNFYLYSSCSPQKQEHLHSLLRLFPTETRTFVFSTQAVPHRNKNIIPILHSGCSPPVTIETRTFLSFTQAVTYLLPQKQEHSYPSLRLFSTCYHRNKNIIPIVYSGCYLLITIETRTFLFSVKRQEVLSGLEKGLNRWTDTCTFVAFLSIHSFFHYFFPFHMGCNIP